MHINVTIERLVLDGLPLDPRAAAQLQAAVETELARLLAGGSLSSDTLVSPAPVLRAATISVGPDMAPAQLGVQIAQAVHGSLGR